MSSYKKQKQAYFDTPYLVSKKKLYERLVSLESYSYTIISFNIYYGAKIAAYLFSLIGNLIPNFYLRFITALFFGFFVSRALMKISYYIEEKQEWVIIAIACFDFLILGIVLRVHDHFGNWKQVYENLIFALFITFLSYWLIKNFVKVVRGLAKKATLEQMIAELDQNLADLKQIKDCEEQKTEKAKKQLGLINKQIAKANLELAEKDQEIRDTTCQYCDIRWKNKKARDAHQAKCPKKATDQYTNYK